MNISTNSRKNSIERLQSPELFCLEEQSSENKMQSCRSTQLRRYIQSLNNLITSKRTAFTLAEVLITIGIIGVVAALTLPMLIQNYKKHVVETKLSKFYTTINQAVARSSAENGEPADWVKDCGISGIPTCTTDESIEWFKTYIGKYMSISKIEPAEDDSGFFVYFADGSIMLMSKWIYDIWFYMSEKAVTNSSNGINKFEFRFMPQMPSWASEPFVKNNAHTIKNTVEPYMYSWDGTIENLYSGSKYSCSGSEAALCTKIIQLNGWKIPKDYPLKF